ncbi:MAG: hypothetical protein EXS14_09570 [Planctomycetes bacterium]|nr:hypothetical protein [Planctomycetota bacterium]
MRWIALVFLVALPLAAQSKSLPWFEGNFDEALKEARERNVPVLVAFNQDEEQSNEAIVEVLYADATFIKMMARCVPVIASIHEHPPVKVGGVNRCSRFPAITCAQHRILETKAREKCWGDQPVSTPSHVVLHPDGTEGARLLDMVGAGDVEGALNVVRKKLGAGLTREQLLAAKQALKSGAQALAAADVVTALASLRAFEKETAGTPMALQGETLNSGIATALDQEIERCRELVRSKQWQAALRAIESGRKAAADLPQSAAFRALETELLKTADGRAAKKALEAEERLKPAMEKGAAFEAKREYAKAANEYLRVVRDAARTPLAQQASAKLNAFAADKDIAALCTAALVEHSAELAFQAARALLGAGKAAEGRAALSDIERQWPATQAGQRAKKLLSTGG